MSSHELIDRTARADFSKAARIAFQRRVVSWLAGKDNSLLSFEEVHKEVPFKGRHDAGLQTVAINNIVGSMGSCRDFDRAFYPRKAEKLGRWISIDKAYYRQINLPPIELYKVGDNYFVVDGHHRVSVARARGQVYIDAYVVEIETNDQSPESAQQDCNDSLSA
ncbi:MAG TPA: hypothetical protein VKQ72_10695 [Aggregatilineales bacterium]|nr:hypothetical protein [Aggregatilineales bacterium]